MELRKLRWMHWVEILVGVVPSAVLMCFALPAGILVGLITLAANVYNAVRYSVFTGIAAGVFLIVGPIVGSAALVALAMVILFGPEQIAERPRCRRTVVVTIALGITGVCVWLTLQALPGAFSLKVGNWVHYAMGASFIVSLRYLYTLLVGVPRKRTGPDFRR